MDLSVQMVRDIPSVLRHHWKEGTFDWFMIFYQVLVHVVGITGFILSPQCKPQTMLLAVTFLPLGGLGITMGAHRLWAHRSYEACLPVKIVLMLLNCMANQRSLYLWCKDHRVHHKYSETDADPHNATRGFFFAHIGWLLVKRHPALLEAGRTMNVDDLREDPVVRFQRATDPVLAAYMCFILPAQICVYGWGESFWLAFFVAGAAKYLVGLHFTFLVNSAAHLYGDHPYDNAFPGENPFVAFCSFGEGWHSWHHKYPFDYATSEFGAFAQYNPTKVFIDILAALGLAWGRKRGSDQWALARARRDRDRANGVPAPKPLVRPWEVASASSSPSSQVTTSNTTSATNPSVTTTATTTKSSGAFLMRSQHLVLSLALVAPVLWCISVMSHS